MELSEQIGCEVMLENIAVVYEKGVLRPLHPLNLPERAQLQIHIVRPGEKTVSETDEAHWVLVRAGLLQPMSLAEAEVVSETDRLQAARAYGNVGPLSNWIIAERNDT